MTRWARGTDANRKKPHEASSWKDLKSASSHQQRDRKTRAKHDKQLKHKSKYFYQQGEWHKKVQPQDEDSDLVTRLKRPEDERPKGIATELEELRKSAALSTDEQQEIEVIIKKDARREKRRVTRLHERQSGKACYHCRNTGHDMAECPELKGSTEHGTGVCFKCGSTEHSVHQCRVKVPAGTFPFAKCFICGEQGHLSKQCPDNPRGLYPNGGCCKLCGSVEHYKKDCPDLQTKQGIQNIELDTLGSGPMSTDAESSRNVCSTVKKKKATKVVKF